MLGWQEMVTLVWQEENKRGFVGYPRTIICEVCVSGTF